MAWAESQRSHEGPRTSFDVKSDKLRVWKQDNDPAVVLVRDDHAGLERLMEMRERSR